jgi:hypothetical protein
MGHLPGVLDAANAVIVRQHEARRIAANSTNRDSSGKTSGLY